MTIRAISHQYQKIRWGPSGDTLEELKDDMKYFLQALDMPVLEKEEIVFASGNED